MRQGFIAWGLILAFLAVLATGCNIFSPQSSKETIEVSFNMPGSACGLQANLDGGTNVTVGPGSTYTFPSVSPGSHTVNLSASNGCGGSGTPCSLSSTSSTFTGSAGQLEVVEISQGSNCYNMNVTAP